MEGIKAMMVLTANENMRQCGSSLTAYGNERWYRGFKELQRYPSHDIAISLPGVNSPKTIENVLSQRPLYADVMK